jgi:hypothetical protein
MSEHTVEGDFVVEWRCVTPTLWVGLGPDGVVGCVEVGRRCLVTDGEGRVFGRCRRLDDARALLGLLCRERGGTLVGR